MKRSIVSAFVLALSMSLFASHALAGGGCGDCGFPLAKIYGKWESGNTEVILQQRSRTGNIVIVDVALIDARTREVIARGHGTGNVNKTDLRVQLKYKNGTRRIFMLSVGRDSSRLEIGSESNINDCRDFAGCSDFTLAVTGQSLQEDDIFENNPDDIEVDFTDTH